jgi:hypothetical protein
LPCSFIISEKETATQNFNNYIWVNELFDKKQEGTAIRQLLQGLNEVLDEALRQNLLITQYKIKELVNPQECLGKKI